MTTGAANVMDRIRFVTTTLSELTFDEIRAQAPRTLAELLPEARLEVLDQAPATAPAARGMQQLDENGWVYRDFFLGPPEPLWFWVTGVQHADTDTELILELYFDRLLAALSGAGYTEELSRQARRDWLTGLPRLESLERELQSASRLRSVLGLIDLKFAGDSAAAEQTLAIRQFARSLRMLLTEGEQAFHLGNGRLALLLPESEQARFNAFLDREAPGSARGWVGLAEARGIEVIKLAEARQFNAGMPAGRLGTAGKRPAGHAAPAPSVPLKVLSGSRSALQLAAPLLGNWHFQTPLTLIFDTPIGYAHEAYSQATGKVLIVTRGTSSGYLHDLRDIEPDGLVQEPSNLGELRTWLQQVADGERVYSGPLQDGRLLPRERAVWRLAALGKQNDEIARALKVTPKTVSNYISNLLEKLDYSHRSALVLGYWAEPDA